MQLTGKIAALTALNRKNSGVNGVEPEKMALTGLKWKNTWVNSVEKEKRALMAFHQVNTVEPEK